MMLRRWDWALSLLVCLLFGWAAARASAGFTLWTFEAQRLAQPMPRPLPPLLLGAGGGALRQAWPGRGRQQRYLVDFIYTRCPSVCRALGSEYQQLQARLAAGPAWARPPLLSVSIDPRDTAADLAAYGARYQADARYWTVAAPAAAAGLSSLLRALQVVVVPDGMDGFVHNGALHLINGEGELLAIYPYTEWEAALAALQAGGDRA